MKNEEHKSFLRIDLIILGIILFVAFSVRAFYHLNKPLADFHSHRQVDTAAVARHFVTDGFDLFRPHFDDLSNLPTTDQLENPEGYRFVEFPLYNALFGLLSMVFPIFSLEVWGRLISIFSSLSIVGVVYYLLYKEHSRIAAIAGSLFFSLAPFVIFFSRVVLPEMISTAAALGALFCLYRMYELQHASKPTKRTIYFVASFLLFMAAMLMKPTTAFFALPLFAIWIMQYSWKAFVSPLVWVYFLGAATPMLGWREYIKEFPEGTPPSWSLIGYVNTPNGFEYIFFGKAVFRWLFFERLNNLIMGGLAVMFPLIGFVTRPRSILFPGMYIGALAYLLTFQGGNIQHVYYQVMILPALAIAVGMGTAFIFEQRKHLLPLIFLVPIVLGIFGFSWAVSWNQVKDYYGYSDLLVNIAGVVDDFTKPSDKIVTDTLGDTTLLYLMNRRGAPHVYKSLPELKDKGFTHFVTMNGAVAEAVTNEYGYQVVFQNKEFTLFKL